MAQQDRKYHALLDFCDILPGDHIYVHTGMRWLSTDISDAFALLNVLIEGVGPQGTICMPSMTWAIQNSAGPDHAEIDLRRTPAATGLVSEIFRRKKNVLRSISYYAPIAAKGKLASVFVSGQEKVINPFGPDSSFARMVAKGVKSVGIGVSLNTSSLAHIVDYKLQNEYPFEVFLNNPISGSVIDLSGKRHHVENIVFNRDLVSLLKPSATFRHSEKLRDALRYMRFGNAIVFSYPSQLYLQEALRIGYRFLRKGSFPPWYCEDDWSPE